MALGYMDIRVLDKIFQTHFTPSQKTFTKEEVLFIVSEVDYPDKYLSAKPNVSRHKVFRYFVQYCLYRNLANYDSLILITGQKGSGKSSFALMLAIEWCKLLGIMFNSDKMIAYSNQQVQDKIDKIGKFMPLICDEAINFATSEGWAKVENKELKKKLAQVRTKHLFYILCFPLKIKKVDKVYLDSFVNYWIDLFGRGRGALFVRDQNPVHDSWRLDEFKDIGSYTEFTSVENIQKKLMRHPNFWYVITAAKPSDKIYSKYLAVRERNVYNNTDILSVVSRQDIYRSLMLKVLQDIMIRDSSITLKRLILHVKVEYDFEVKESDLKLVFEDANQLLLKIKEERRKDVEFQEEGNAG